MEEIKGIIALLVIAFVIYVIFFKELPAGYHEKVGEEYHPVKTTLFKAFLNK